VKVFRVKRLWAVFCVVVLLLGFFSNVGGFYSDIQRRREPRVDISYFVTDSNHAIRIVDPLEVKIEVGLEELSSGRIPFPINLAVRNEDSEPLDLVRVELTYDRELIVKPGGRAKIDPENRILIYEHGLGTLESTEFYTPIDTVDTIYVPLSFAFVPALSLSSDGVPFYSWVTILSPYSGKFSDKKIAIGVRIFARDRPPTSGVINLTLVANAEVYLLFGESEMVSSELEDKDFRLFGEDPAQHSQILDHWQRQDVAGGYLVDYFKSSGVGGVFQFIQIGGQTRTLIIDSNSDGLADINIFDNTGDGIPDHKFIITPPAEMPDWLPESVQ